MVEFLIETSGQVSAFGTSLDRCSMQHALRAYPCKSINYETKQESWEAIGVLRGAANRSWHCDRLQKMPRQEQCETCMIRQRTRCVVQWNDIISVAAAAVGTPPSTIFLGRNSKWDEFDSIPPARLEIPNNTAELGSFRSLLFSCFTFPFSTISQLFKPIRQYNCPGFLANRASLLLYSGT